MTTRRLPGYPTARNPRTRLPVRGTMLLPVKEAAEALGVSVSGVRRGLKSGRLKGHKRETPQGHVWLIEVPDAQGVATRTPDSRVPGDRATTRVPEYPAGPENAPRVPDYPADTPEAPQEPPGGTLLADRAAEMARYSRELLAPVLARLEAQAERIGRLEAENDHLRAQLAGAPSSTAGTTNGVAHHDQAAEIDAAAPPETQSAPPAGGQAGRSWWRRLLWGEEGAVL